jgi:hypothetical protein
MFTPKDPSPGPTPKPPVSRIVSQSSELWTAKGERSECAGLRTYEHEFEQILWTAIRRFTFSDTALHFSRVPHVARPSPPADSCRAD